jgi:hypothetical protein
MASVVAEMSSFSPPFTLPVYLVGFRQQDAENIDIGVMRTISEIFSIPGS